MTHVDEPFVTSHRGGNDVSFHMGTKTPSCLKSVWHRHVCCSGMVIFYHRELPRPNCEQGSGAIFLSRTAS